MYQANYAPFIQLKAESLKPKANTNTVTSYRRGYSGTYEL
jgi:hypothetical protein